MMLVRISVALAVVYCVGCASTQSEYEKLSTLRNDVDAVKALPGDADVLVAQAKIVEDKMHDQLGWDETVACDISELYVVIGNRQSAQRSGNAGAGQQVLDIYEYATVMCADRSFPFTNHLKAAKDLKAGPHEVDRIEKRKLAIEESEERQPHKIAFALCLDASPRCIAQSLERAKKKAENAYFRADFLENSGFIEVAEYFRLSALQSEAFINDITSPQVKVSDSLRPALREGQEIRWLPEEPLVISTGDESVVSLQRMRDAVMEQVGMQFTVSVFNGSTESIKFSLEDISVEQGGKKIALLTESQIAERQQAIAKRKAALPMMMSVMALTGNVAGLASGDAAFANQMNTLAMTSAKDWQATAENAEKHSVAAISRFRRSALSQVQVAPLQIGGGFFVSERLNRKEGFVVRVRTKGSGGQLDEHVFEYKPKTTSAKRADAKLAENRV